jgi:hypothetical protein
MSNRACSVAAFPRLQLGELVGDLAVEELACGGARQGEPAALGAIDHGAARAEGPTLGVQGVRRGGCH